MARLVVASSPLLDHYEETALIQGEDWRAAGLPLRSCGSGSRRRGQSVLWSHSVGAWGKDNLSCHSIAFFAFQLLVVGDLFSSVPKSLLSPVGHLLRFA